MAVVVCKECGKELSTEEAKCPHCGGTLKKRRVSVFEKISYIFMLIVVFIALFGLFEKKVDKPSSVKATDVGAEAKNDKPIP